jgi:hypothetical protein
MPALRAAAQRQQPPTMAPNDTMMMMAFEHAGTPSSHQAFLRGARHQPPSRANMLPRAKPRAPEALGLSMAYSSQSSTRTLR